MQQAHPIAPVYDCRSKILILGSFPSVKSRQSGFYYGHPQNRFWPVLAAVLGEPSGDSPAEKTTFLLRHGIALWDVIAACSITGSADSSIADVTPADLGPLLEAAPISQIIVNGKTAEKFYRKYQLDKTNRPALCLPSTSPANAAWSLARLCGAWGILRQYL